MMQSFKSRLKEWLPQSFLQLLKEEYKYGFFGDYSSWEAAAQTSGGYDELEILHKVKSASLQVKRGEASYERDSVIFEQVEYSFPILAALLQAALSSQGHLSVLDFGGSLGSSYYQHRDFLSDLQSLNWNVVEQPHFVDCGKKHFEDNILKFFHNVDECLQSESPQVLLLFSVVQYLEKPYSFLEKLVTYGFNTILVDRTAFGQQDRDRLTVQKVPPRIYPASYPAWFLDEQKFLKVFAKQYHLVYDFESPDTANIPSEFKGFYFKRNDC